MKKVGCNVRGTGGGISDTFLMSENLVDMFVHTLMMVADTVDGVNVHVEVLLEQELEM